MTAEERKDATGKGKRAGTMSDDDHDMDPDGVKLTDSKTARAAIDVEAANAGTTETEKADLKELNKN